MSAVTEVRDITRGTGAALTALVSGSVVLAGRICRCASRAIAWAWDQASADPEATRAAQAKADKAANSKTRRGKTRRGKTAPQAGQDQADGHDDNDGGDDNGGKEPVRRAARPVKPVRRPIPESVAMLAFGGVLVFGGVGTVGAVAWPYVQMLAPWRGLIAAAGGIAWMVAAWMVAAPPSPLQHHHEDGEQIQDEDQDQDQDEEVDEDEEPEGHDLTPGDQLARHVLTQLAWLEAAHGGKGGLHVVSLIASAEREGILSPDSMTKKDMRDWLENSRFPVAKSTRQPKGVPPLGSEVDYGVKVEELSGVLGGPVTATLLRLYGTPVTAPPSAPAQHPLQTSAEAPVEAPSDAPAGMPAGGVPGPCLRLVQPLSPDPSQGSTQNTA